MSGVQATYPVVRLREGTPLGAAYTIRGVLGEGGMGVVYSAFDRSRERMVAIKCLHANLLGDSGIRRRFMREAKVLKSFVHRNVVSVFDLIEHQGMLGMVMEPVDGPSVAKHLARWKGHMPWTEIRTILCGALDAMEAAHARGIIHRDLKPDNILLETTHDGELRPKVVDFGIARILEGTTYTVSGALLGTCGYMSPEQVRGDRTIDHRSDIYSLGVTAYEMCTGQPPFKGENQFALMMAHVSSTPAPPSQLRPDIPPALESLILACLAKSPSERPVSCAQVRARLIEALASTALPRVRERLSTVPPPPVLRDADGCESVLVPAGEFQSGPDRRSVFLDSYYIDKTPITNRQFEVFLRTTGYKPEHDHARRFLAHWETGKIPRGLEEHPVVFVSWDDANAYASWAGRRLPTEAQWEKAARGTDGRKYPWGRTPPNASLAQFGNATRGTSRVDAHPLGASPFGALEMAGNIWEWCDEIDDVEFYLRGPNLNPHNTVRIGDDPLFVVRGGSWMFGSQSLRTFARKSFSSQYRVGGVGFRCVRDA